MASLGTKLVDSSEITRAPVDIGLRRRQSPANNKHKLQQSLSVLADLCGIGSGAFLAIALRFPFNAAIPAGRKFFRPRFEVAEHVAISVLYAVLIVLFCNAQKLYSVYQASSWAKDLTIILKSILLATVLLGGFLFVTGVKSTSRLIIASAAVSALITMFTWRQLRRRSLRRAMADGLTCHNVLIIGTDSLAKALAQHLTLHRHFGFLVVGHLCLASSPRESQHATNVLGSVAQLKDLCRTHFIDEILVCVHDRSTVMQVIAEARECGVGVRVIPDLYDGLACSTQFDYLGDFPSMVLVQRDTPALAMRLKRALDMCLSGLGLLALSPFLILVAIAIKLDSPGPVFYASKRVGRKGRVFSCYKFRTMVANADSLQKTLEHLNERDGILFKITKDPRITRLGGWMRKHSVDELAQLWNVFKGDMSLVGPRPPLLSEVKQYELEFLKRLEVAPGITGLWQVEARNNPSFDRYISLDLAYVENWSLSLDLLILFRTIAVVCAGTGT